MDEILNALGGEEWLKLALGVKEINYTVYTGLRGYPGPRIVITFMLDKHNVENKCSSDGFITHLTSIDFNGNTVKIAIHFLEFFSVLEVFTGPPAREHQAIHVPHGDSCFEKIPDLFEKTTKISLNPFHG